MRFRLGGGWRASRLVQNMTATRRAVIDIGTNSVKVLVADVIGKSVAPVWEESEQTRLGRGFYDSLSLRPEAIRATAHAVSRFAARAQRLQASSIKVIATSIGREALNHASLVHAVHDAAGLNVETISGEQEADWAFVGVRTDPDLGREPLLVLDVGGGSTEFVFGTDHCQEWRQSFSIGTVRLHEEMRPADPPSSGDWHRCKSWLDEALKQVKPFVDPWLVRNDAPPTLLVGTGGTTSILAAMELRLTTFDRERIERTRLSRERVWQLKKELWRLPLVDRQRLAGLPPNRADVILFGVAIYALVMDTFAFDQLHVSTRGLRFGAVVDEPFWQR